MKKKPAVEREIVKSLLQKGKKIKADQEAFSIADLLKLMRKAFGMTQKILAERAGVPQSTIARIESGIVSPSEEMVKKIFNAFSCDLSYVPVPRFEVFDDFIRARAAKIAKKRMKYLEGTMALEEQLPSKRFRKDLLESEIEEILESPGAIWDEDHDTV